MKRLLKPFVLLGKFLRYCWERRNAKGREFD